VAQVPLDQRLIVALDVPDRELAMDLVRRTRGVVSHYKVGLELFLADGLHMVDWLRKEGLEVFLDLKLHDIPNTVAGALRQIARRGLSLTTVHALGGREVMRSIGMALSEQTSVPGQPVVKVIGVTVLTHHTGASLDELGLGDDTAAAQARLLDVLLDAGLDGCVCAVEEVEHVRKKAGEDFIIVTPGIRPAGSALGDQARTATPFDAAKAGSDYLVVGRPVRSAPDPAAACASILEEIQKGLEARR
jgi:orotidine-5'-phosphate decarboxylase